MAGFPTEHWLQPDEIDGAERKTDFGAKEE